MFSATTFVIVCFAMAIFTQSNAIREYISQFWIFRPTLYVMGREIPPFETTILACKTISFEHQSAPSFVFISGSLMFIIFGTPTLPIMVIFTALIWSWFSKVLYRFLTVMFPYKMCTSFLKRCSWEVFHKTFCSLVPRRFTQSCKRHLLPSFFTVFISFERHTAHYTINSLDLDSKLVASGGQY